MCDCVYVHVSVFVSLTLMPHIFSQTQHSLLDFPTLFPTFPLFSTFPLSSRPSYSLLDLLALFPTFVCSSLITNSLHNLLSPCIYTFTHTRPLHPHTLPIHCLEPHIIKLTHILYPHFPQPPTVTTFIYPPTSPTPTHIFYPLTSPTPTNIFYPPTATTHFIHTYPLLHTYFIHPRHPHSPTATTYFTLPLHPHPSTDTTYTLPTHFIHTHLLQHILYLPTSQIHCYHIRYPST